MRGANECTRNFCERTDWRRTSEAEEGGRHEGEEKNEECEEGGELARRVEGRDIVNAGGTEEANDEEEHGPNVPAGPVAEVSESDEKNGEEPGRDLVGTRTEGAKNVAAVKLSGRKKVEGGGEKADPGGATNGRKEQGIGVDPGMKERVKQTKKQWSTEDDVGLRRIGVGKRRDDSGMEDAINERRNGKNEAYERTGSTNIEERASGADGRTDENKGAESADEGGKGYEKRIGGMDVMATAGEEVAKLMSEKNDEQRGGERQTGEKTSRISVKEGEGVDEFIHGGGLVVGISECELRAGSEASGEGEKKKKDGENEGFGGRVRESGKIIPGVWRGQVPVLRWRHSLEGRIRSV
ncbi:MAG TPA: hypothetical protein VJN42_07385 [Candidatus Acidoferrum sp.]|nr:hypothetical protein [Candidatus Acidoferrum sp.]